MKPTLITMLAFLVATVIGTVSAKSILPEQHDCKNWSNIVATYKAINLKMDYEHLSPNAGLLESIEIVELPDPTVSGGEMDCYMKFPAHAIFEYAPSGIFLLHNPRAGPAWFDQVLRPLELNPFIVINSADNSVYPILGIKSYHIDKPLPNSAVKYTIGSRTGTIRFREKWYLTNHGATNFIQDPYLLLWNVKEQITKQDEVRFVFQNAKEVHMEYDFTLKVDQLKSWASLMQLATNKEYSELFGGKVILDKSNIAEGSTPHRDLACWEINEVKKRLYQSVADSLINIPNPHTDGSDCYFRFVDKQSVYLFPVLGYPDRSRLGASIIPFVKSIDGFAPSTGFEVTTNIGVEVPANTRVYYRIGANPTKQVFDGFEFKKNEVSDNHRIGIVYREWSNLGILTEITDVWLEYQQINPDGMPKVVVAIGPAGRYGSITLTEGQLRTWTAIRTIVEQDNSAMNPNQRIYAKWLDPRWFSPSADEL